jgi:hypothetical protein
MQPPNTQNAGAGDANDNTRFPLRRFVLLLAVLVLVSYPQVFLGLQTFVYHDFGYFSYPIAWHLRESFWQGQMPLWNPLNNCGQPFLAEWNTQALYPPALFYLLFPLSWSLGVFCLLHLFLGGLGMFLLAQRWTQGNRFAAAIAGVTFAFNGLTLGSLIWPATISGLAWMPWVVWLAERAWREGGRMLILAAITGALQMLSGAVEVILLTWLLLGILALVEFIRGGLPRGKMFLRVSVVVLLISGLCAAQLLPFFDLLNHSQRQQNYFTADSSMPLTGWANFLVPLFRCQPENGVFTQPGQYWIVSYYAGVITLALAAWAVCRLQNARVWLLAALTLLCLVLALGNATPLYGWLCRHVGVIGLMRFPVKFVILPAFALPILAACGLAERQRRAVHATSRLWLFIWLAVVALIVGILIWALQSPVTDDNHSVVLFNGLARVIFFTAIVGGLFILEKVRGDRLRRWLQILVLLFVWLDLFRQIPQPPTVNATIYQPDMPRPLHAPQFGTARAMIPNAVRDQLTFAVNPGAVDNYLAHRFALFSDCNLLDGLPKCDGFFPLYLREQTLLYDDLNDPLLDFLGASEMLTIQSNAWTWAPRANPMPLLTGGQKALFANDETTLLKLADTNFNPRAEVYLPPEAAAVITATNLATVKISPVKFSAQEIDANIVADAPAMLVAAQTFYHPWRAFVDGRPTRLWRANYAFQALQIPAGTHQVKLVYVDWNFRLGMMLSLATLACCLLFYWLCPRHGKAG